MANLTKSLVLLPSGQEYEFVGKHWFGVCSSSATVTTKSVLIPGFTSADFVNGTQVTIMFTVAPAVNIANLNINSTGAKTIYSNYPNGVKQYEWSGNTIMTFCYYGSYWYIIDGVHATTTYWGKTKLSSTIADDDTVALTPKAVYDAGYLTLADLPIYQGGVS